MEAKFHREKTAKIYAFVAAARPAPDARIEPRLMSAEIVPMRAAARPEPIAAVPPIACNDFGSGWYHGAAIDKGEPSRH